MNDKFLSLLGMARRAGKISLGHDAAKDSANRKKAKLIVLALDASERLKKEFRTKAENTHTDILFSHYTIEEISLAVGSKAGVLTVDDGGFSKKLREIYSVEHKED